MNSSEPVRWQSTEVAPLTAASLEALLANRLPAIRIPDFAGVADCEALAAAIDRVAFDSYREVSPSIRRIGVTQFECRSIGKQAYFCAVEQATKQREEIAAQVFDPIERICALLRSHWPGAVSIAQEPDFGDYFAGLVRQINNSARLHVDVSKLDAVGWAVEELVSQLVWNFFIQTPKAGGECIIYDRLWRSEDEAQRIEDSYGYSRELVRDRPQVRLSPAQGEVLIFNCRNYHEVLPADGARITMGSFVGQTAGGELLLWS